MHIRSWQGEARNFFQNLKIKIHVCCDTVEDITEYNEFYPCENLWYDSFQIT